MLSSLLNHAHKPITLIGRLNLLVTFSVMSVHTLLNKINVKNASISDISIPHYIFLFLFLYKKVKVDDTTIMMVTSIPPSPPHNLCQHDHFQSGTNLKKKTLYGKTIKGRFLFFYCFPQPF